jgi:NADH:ubiquinone oxidoreductase subunit
MHIATSIYTFLFGKFVGNDELGNSYYCNKRTGKNQKRWVIYKGVAEASKVPDIWHRWLHYTSDKLPKELQIEKKSWQKQHLPNFTQTSKAYHPDDSRVEKEPYEAWKPGN